MAWTPGLRKAARELEAPYDDVPDHLRQPLTAWAMSILTSGQYTETDRYRRLALHMRFPAQADGYSGVTELRYACASGTFVLDLIEAELEIFDFPSSALDLSRLLDEGNSVYRVASDRRGLEVRVAPGVREAVAAVVDSATGNEGDHLALAWNAAYGRTPDPVRSFSESIKAVEHAMAPLISPGNTRQTLGTMLRDIRAKPAKWAFVIESKTSSPDVVVSMMSSLWDGQTSRHGGAASQPESPDAARAAVHLAASLVQFSVSGAFGPVAGTDT